MDGVLAADLSFFFKAPQKPAKLLLLQNFGLWKKNLEK